MTVPMLILSGPIGVGKSTVLGELSEVLTECGEAFAAIDIDAATQVFPRSPGDPFGMRLAARNLQCLWANARESGSERLVIASVIETGDDLDPLVNAVPDAEPYVVLLDAHDDALLTRVTQREIGSALTWHLDRSLQLAEILRSATVHDVVVRSDDRPLRVIAEEVLKSAGWAVGDDH